MVVIGNSFTSLVLIFIIRSITLSSTEEDAHFRTIYLLMKWESNWSWNLMLRKQLCVGLRRSGRQAIKDTARNKNRKKWGSYVFSGWTTGAWSMLRTQSQATLKDLCCVTFLSWFKKCRPAKINNSYCSNIVMSLTRVSHTSTGGRLLMPASQRSIKNWSKK